jgi:hypothetical protein
VYVELGESEKAIAKYQEALAIYLKVSG